MTKKEIMKKAHKMTKKIKREYPEVDYRFQFGLCLSFLMNEVKETIEIEMRELTIGSPKQIAWAKKIRENLLEEGKDNMNFDIELSKTVDEIMEAKTTYKAFIDFVNTQDARWVIDNLRNRSYLWIVENLL